MGPWGWFDEFNENKRPVLESLGGGLGVPGGQGGHFGIPWGHQAGLMSLQMILEAYKPVYM